ncbi:MAG: hypothetical protein AW07_03583 [Candidatus Accumulibacter sp. SK-11]|nr:MAG: hypothetical protein AW07_03583 [Candidatus Accumulibacter sp. SK-11]
MEVSGARDGTDGVLQEPEAFEMPALRWSLLKMATPPTTSEWPLRYLVLEW